MAITFCEVNPLEQRLKLKAVCCISGSLKKNGDMGLVKSHCKDFERGSLETESPLPW